MSDGEGERSVAEELAEWVRTYGAGFTSTTEGLSTTYHAMLRFGENGSARPGPISSALRPDIEEFVEGLETKFIDLEGLSMDEKLKAFGNFNPHSREMHELKMVSMLKMYRNMASAANMLEAELGIAMAFQMGMELGALVKEYEWKFQHEEAALEGHRHREGRKAGQPLAAKARRKAGEKRKRAIVAAANRLIGIERNLAHNLSELARRIEAERLDELRQSDGTFLGENIIRRHLGAARKAGQFE